MAEALFRALFEKVQSLAHNQFTTSGIKGKAKKLSRNLEVIIAFAEDAEDQEITNRNMKVWLQQLKDAAHVLDDILDGCSIESRRLTGNPKNFWFRREIGNRLKEIIERLDDIAGRKNMFILQERRGMRDEVNEVDELRQTVSIIGESQVYGRQDDKEKIVEFLLSQARSSDFLSVYPIVGLGGMGKTTLSQMVFNDDRVSHNFYLKLWVCVSENFSVKRILCSIIESVTGERSDASDLNEIERKVQELLQGKRYLLVLDDVWIQNQQMKSGLSHEKWNHLRHVLSCGSKGSSVLVSTRDMDVAQIMGTCQAHRLQGLSEDDCWLLFKQRAFDYEFDDEERAELVAIGKEIIKKCRGSPLAARALGSLLRCKYDENEWLGVKESTLWGLDDETSIFQALRLSYFHLTPISRQCFAFCAIFPKDTEIIKEQLIYLWMANGFIQSRENTEVEDVGDMIWNELYSKSFFQNISTNFKGKTTFRMHDLMHDLAESITGKECVILKNANMTDLSANTHHVSFYNSKEDSSFNEGTLMKVVSLRTLYQSEPSFGGKYACLPTHRRLRVLQSSSFNLSSLGSLIHLRYLELFEIEIRSLPDSIYKLQKLEILKLKWLRKLNSLPEHLTCLQNLRHLVIEDCHSLSGMFPNIGQLSCLRTLSDYIVSSEIGHSLAELHNLKLGGSLHIKGLENVGSPSKAQDANLKAKRDLRELTLSWESGNSETEERHATNLDEVLEGLQPHSNIMKLRIIGYAGKSPSWIGMLCNLVDLVLSDCSKCVQLPLLGKLPSLKKLTLWEVNDLKYIDDGESYDCVEVIAFPSLNELILYELPKLKRLLKEGRGEIFTHLSKLVVHNCPELELPLCIQSLTSLDLDGYTNSLASFPWGTCLQTLSISNFPRLKEFPEEFFNNLKALERLEIHSCKELESLPEQGWEGLSSLQSLDLISCHTLRSLPAGIRHLTSLDRLIVRDCPALTERCKRVTGEDWDKIAHVPLKIIQ